MDDGSTPGSAPSDSQTVQVHPPTLTPGYRIGPYQIESTLGTGGMGTVFRAVDTRLNRGVAIKISAQRFNARFEREARAIAALNHPNVCTLYDVGSLPEGPSYLVTELVVGETLRDWLMRPPSLEQSLLVARQILEALRAAHDARIVHRDLKPGNIMVRADGRVKVLDFGLAKWIPGGGEGPSQDGATIPGQVLGTMAYMAPEQLQNRDVDGRCDLFAFGIILHEMLAGRHPWPRNTAVETMSAILSDDPPAMEGPWAPVVHKLLAKKRADRYATAQDVLDALREPAAASTPSVTRLIVLPFRILRHHDESDFLAASLPDAISSSLAGIDSLVVRSSMMASRIASSGFDVKMIAEQAHVDAILTGTLLSDGQQLRINTQLMRAPDGALLWSYHSRASLADVFQLQDELVDRIVKALALPLSAGEKLSLKRDAPGSALAYELYLRGNQASVGHDSMSQHNVELARDLYVRATEADPDFAPAWARLGRAYRIIGKYAFGDLNENFHRADDAFKRAFAINPDSAVAHGYYTYLQTDMGRALEAMRRLLQRARSHRNDPDLLVGMVHAFRYCGLLEASVAADRAARRLDQNVVTTASFSYVVLRQFRSAIDVATDQWTRAYALAAMGHADEAVACYAGLERSVATEQHRLLAASYRYFLQGDSPRSLEALEETVRRPGVMVVDPEAHHTIAVSFARLGQAGRALELLSRALDSGYNCHASMLTDPSFDALRADPRFERLLKRGETMTAEAWKTFRECGGPELLGVDLTA